MNTPKFDASGKPVHQICQWCGLVTRGPHKDKRFPYRTVPPDQRPEAADEHGVYNAAEARARGLEHNIDGHICEDCFNREMAATRAKAEETRRRKEQEQNGGQGGQDSGETPAG